LRRLGRSIRLERVEFKTTSSTWAATRCSRFSSWFVGEDSLRRAVLSLRAAGSSDHRTLRVVAGRPRGPNSGTCWYGCGRELPRGLRFSACMRGGNVMSMRALAMLFRRTCHSMLCRQRAGRLRAVHDGRGDRARYVEEIQKVQPHGPYHLGGGCYAALSPSRWRGFWRSGASAWRRCS